MGFVHVMREFHTQNWCRVVHRVDASACRLTHGCGGLKHITVKSLWVQEVVHEYLITIERVPRDAMHAHMLASPSSADELTKYLTELNGFRSVELDDAGRDRGIEEEFGAEVPREWQR